MNSNGFVENRISTGVLYIFKSFFRIFGSCLGMFGVDTMGHFFKPTVTEVIRSGRAGLLGHESWCPQHRGLSMLLPSGLRVGKRPMVRILQKITIGCCKYFGNDIPPKLGDAEWGAEVGQLTGSSRGRSAAI